MLAFVASLALLATGCQGAAKVPLHPSTAPASPAVNPASESAGADEASGVSSGVLFGGNAPLALESSKLGRNLAIVRVYYHIGQPFPGGPADDPSVNGPSTKAILNRGSTLLVSMDSYSSGPSYAAIISGRYDTSILTFLESVNEAAVQHHLAAIYICFEHEPENYSHLHLGSPQQFVKAWDHIHALAAQAHLNWNDGGHLHWVWIMIHSAFNSNGAASLWFPGRKEVDIVGVDGYNSYGCRVARHAANATQGQATPKSIFNPALNFAVAHGRLPLFISEWGSDPQPAGTQVGFIREMESFVDANQEIGAVLYWDSPGVGCNYSINSQLASISAMTTLAHSSRLQGRLTK